jgi:hypothetical protein
VWQFRPEAVLTPALHPLMAQYIIPNVRRDVAGRLVAFGCLRSGPRLHDRARESVRQGGQVSSTSRLAPLGSPIPVAGKRGIGKTGKLRSRVASRVNPQSFAVRAPVGSLPPRIRRWTPLGHALSPRDKGSWAFYGNTRVEGERFAAGGIRISDSSQSRRRRAARPLSRTGSLTLDNGGS